MKRNRLEGVLVRNRKHMVVDLSLAAFFLMALLFSGLAFGSQVPKLNAQPDMARIRALPASVDVAAVSLEPADTSSPELAYR